MVLPPSLGDSAYVDCQNKEIIPRMWNKYIFKIKKCYWLDSLPLNLKITCKWNKYKPIVLRCN